MAKSLFPKSKSNTKFSRPEGAGNFDNMDDYNIVQSISLRQGTIQHTPANNKDISNKQYVDDTAAPAGNDKEVQYNDNGSFGASSNFYTDLNANSVRRLLEASRFL